MEIETRKILSLSVAMVMVMPIVGYRGALMLESENALSEQIAEAATKESSQLLDLYDLPFEDNLEQDEGERPMEPKMETANIEVEDLALKEIGDETKPSDISAQSGPILISRENQAVKIYTVCWATAQKRIVAFRYKYEPEADTFRTSPISQPDTDIA